MAKVERLERALAPMGLLALIGERDDHGYALVHRLLTLGIDASPGLVYPILRSFEDENWVTPQWEADVSGGPPRKVYSLTAQGRDELARSVSKANSIIIAVARKAEI